MTPLDDNDNVREHGRAAFDPVGDAQPFTPSRSGATGSHASAGAVLVSPLPLVRLADLPEPGPPEWLIDQLWTLGAFGLVGAEPKSWKSYLTLYLAICVASGRRAFDRFDARQGRVVIFAAEGGTGLLRRRAGELCRGMGIAIPPDLDAIDLPVLRLDDPTMVARVLATVRTVRPSLLVLDPLRELHTLDENDAATVATLLGPLRTLQREGCAVQVVHHMGKAGEGRGSKRGGQRLRGSSALHAATDSALYLTTEGTGASKRVHVDAEHRAAAEPEPFTLALQHRELPEPRAWFEIVTDGDVKEDRDAGRDLADHERERRKVLAVISKAAMRGREPLKSKAAIAAAAKIRPGTAGKLVDLLIEESVIRRDDANAYRPAAAGADDAP